MLGKRAHSSDRPNDARPHGSQKEFFFWGMHLTPLSYTCSATLRGAIFTERITGVTYLLETNELRGTCNNLSKPNSSFLVFTLHGNSHGHSLLFPSRRESSAHPNSFFIAFKAGMLLKTRESRTKYTKGLVSGVRCQVHLLEGLRSLRRNSPPQVTTPAPSAPPLLNQRLWSAGMGAFTPGR